MGIITMGERKARKTHCCWFCEEQIEKGEVYSYQVMKEDYIWDSKCHTYCTQFIQKNSARLLVDDGILQLSEYEQEITVDFVIFSAPYILQAGRG